MKTRQEVEKDFEDLRDNYMPTGINRYFIWRLVVVVVDVLLDIREELSYIRQILKVGSGATRPRDGD